MYFPRDFMFKTLINPLPPPLLSSLHFLSPSFLKRIVITVFLILENHLQRKDDFSLSGLPRAHSSPTGRSIPRRTPEVRESSRPALQVILHSTPASKARTKQLPASELRLWPPSPGLWFLPPSSRCSDGHFQSPIPFGSAEAGPLENPFS